VDQELITLMASAQVASSQMDAALDLYADGGQRAAGDAGAAWLVAQHVAAFHGANLDRFNQMYRP
jgi:hypothetical protein